MTRGRKDLGIFVGKGAKLAEGSKMDGIVSLNGKNGE